MDIGLTRLMAEGSTAHLEESRRFNTAAGGGDQAAPDPGTPEGLRAARSRLSHRPPDARAVEHVAVAGTRRVPVRIIAPRRPPVRATYLQIHGGGFYMDSAARSDAANALLADAMGIAVVSIDYRLAPEHPWPAAPDDCETAALWLIESVDDGPGPSPLIIGGASAGANLALATLLRLRDRGQVQRFVGAVLQFGAYDLSGQSPGGRMYADEWFIRAYAGHVADRTNPDISPLYGDLGGLPPTLVMVGARDILLEDNLAMAVRLSAAGNDIDLRIYPESPHGFTSLPTAMAAAALKGMEAWMGERLDQH